MLTSYTFSEEETFPIFENLLKTSGTMTKAMSCLKIPLSSMRVNRFVSWENIVSMFQTSTLSPPPPNWSLNPLEETLLQPALKSFFAVFIQYSEGLENKLTRAPLLSLAKSIYWKLILLTCKKQRQFGRIKKVQPRPLFQNCQFPNRNLDSYNLLVSHLSVQWIGLNWSRKLGKKWNIFDRLSFLASVTFKNVSYLINNKCSDYHRNSRALIFPGLLLTHWYSDWIVDFI